MVREWLGVFDLSEQGLMQGWLSMVFYALGAIFLLLALDFIRRKVWPKKINHTRR